MSISHQLCGQTNCLYGSPADGRAGLLVNGRSAWIIAEKWA